MRMPSDVATILDEDVYPYLTPSLEALLRTTDVAVSHDIKALLSAASSIGVSDLIRLEADGATVALPSEMARWRQDQTQRIFIETCLLAGISATRIAEDLRAMWGISANEATVERFGQLFCDREMLHGPGWHEYAHCIGADEAQFKISLISQPEVFIRWKLGAPVVPDVGVIMDRIIADSYFTEKILKTRAGENGVNLGRDELARVKLERDTLFKAIDRRLKLKQLEAETGTGSDATAAAKMLKDVVMDLEDHKFALMDEVLGGERPALVSDLESA